MFIVLRFFIHSDRTSPLKRIIIIENLNDDAFEMMVRKSPYTRLRFISLLISFLESNKLVGCLLLAKFRMRSSAPRSFLSRDEACVVVECKSSLTSSPMNLFSGSLSVTL